MLHEHELEDYCKRCGSILVNDEEEYCHFCIKALSIEGEIDSEKDVDI